MDYEFLGEKTVKNIKKPVRAYRVGKDPALSRKPGRSELPDKPSIAVLPFVNMNGDPQQDYLSDGITENLITDLSKISGPFRHFEQFRVHLQGKGRKGGASRRRSWGYGTCWRGVSKRLAIASGSRPSSLTPSAVTTSGREQYDRDMEDIFLLQDDVTEKIIATLRVRVEKAEIERVLRKPTESLKAYDYALRGKSVPV